MRNRRWTCDERHAGRGAAQFRQRIALATLAGRAIRIEDIRYQDESPGLRPEEANFLRLIEKLTNGCTIEINETGTSCSTGPEYSRSATRANSGTTAVPLGLVFLEGIIPLAPFGVRCVTCTASRTTNVISTSTASKRHGTAAQAFELEGLDEGLVAPPKGGGELHLPMRAS